MPAATRAFMFADTYGFMLASSVAAKSLATDSALGHAVAAPTPSRDLSLPGMDLKRY